MITIILRNAASILISVIVAILLLAAIEWLGTILHPFPADFGGTRDEVAAHVANYPAWILALLGGVGWGTAIFVASWLATRISNNRKAAFGIGVGALLLAGAIFNMAMLPYPIWYWVLELVLLPTGIYFGSKLASVQSTPH